MSDKQDEEEHSTVEITVKSWDTVGTWCWDSSLDSCGICKNFLVNLCVECAASGIEPCTKSDYAGTTKTEQIMSSIVLNTEGDELQGNCSIAWGTCGHLFHSHCMSRWLVSREACPLCGKRWTLFKLTGIM